MRNLIPYTVNSLNHGSWFTLAKNASAVVIYNTSAYDINVRVGSNTAFIPANVGDLVYTNLTTWDGVIDVTPVSMIFGSSVPSTSLQGYFYDQNERILGTFPISLNRISNIGNTVPIPVGTTNAQQLTWLTVPASGFPTEIIQILSLEFPGGFYSMEFRDSGFLFIAGKLRHLNTFNSALFKVIPADESGLTTDSSVEIDAITLVVNNKTSLDSANITTDGAGNMTFNAVGGTVNVPIFNVAGTRFQAGGALNCSFFAGNTLITSVGNIQTIGNISSSTGNLTIFGTSSRDNAKITTDGIGNETFTVGNITLTAGNLNINAGDIVTGTPALHTSKTLLQAGLNCTISIYNNDGTNGNISFNVGNVGGIYQSTTNEQFEAGNGYVRACSDTIQLKNKTQTQQLTVNTGSQLQFNGTAGTISGMKYFTGTGTTTVTHGLGVTPSCVIPAVNQVATAQISVSAIGATQFTINVGAGIPWYALAYVA